MATTSSPAPILFSVLSSSHDNNDDFVNQLRNHLIQIESTVQDTLNKIHQRQPYTSIETNTNKVDSKIRNHFFDVLKDVAIKNNLPFDEPFFREQFLEKQDSSSSPKVDIVRDATSIIIQTNDQDLSPVNNARRSQFAPVLSSTPMHQASPITPIPVDLSLATPSIVPVLTVHSNDLSAIPPSAIVPQRANITRPAGRPPRIPRDASVTRQKKNPSPIKEQQEETVQAKEFHSISKRRIKTKQEIIEQQNETIPDRINQVQATPLRGKKKKKEIMEEEINIIPQLEPPPPPSLVTENENIPKKTRGGRGKKKDEEDIKPTRTTSSRNRKKQEEEDIPVPPKRTTRNKKLVEPVENLPPTTKIRATPSRGKKKAPPELIISLSPKKITKSKKRKGNEITNENPIDTIQPPCPKRRGGRNTKSKNSSPVETIIISPIVEQELQPQQPASTRSSRRVKKDIDIPIEKQEDIVLNKKTRIGRGKKKNEPINTDIPITVVDVVMTSVTVSASIPSSLSMDSLVAKPPRPPVLRKKKSLAMPPLPQMSPSTPPSAQRIQSTSPVNDKPLLPIPVPTNGGRRRQQQRRIASSPRPIEETALEIIPSITRNQKRTRSSVATTPKRTRSSVVTTPKRARHENLIVTAVPSTPGKKRNKCTCEKRRNKICDICAAAIDG